MDHRRFYFDRKTDVSGNSGTGRVAEGVRFSNGKVAVCWITETTSTTIYDNMADVAALHSHEGATEVVWIDEDESLTRPMRWLTPDRK